MLKPVVPGDEKGKGGEGRGEGDLTGAPGGV